MNVWIFVLTFLTVAMSSPVSAREPVAGRDFTLALSDPTARALGGVCFSTDVGAEALPCNPAFISRESEPDFRAQFFFGNNVSYLEEVPRILEGSGSREDVRRLFSQTRSSELEAQLEAGYRRPTFGVALMPVRWLYSSRIRNPSLPVMSILAAEERGVRAQFGSYVKNDWSWGVQLRGVSRRYVVKTFTLTDVLAEDGKSLFSAEHQQALYIEPGLLKEWPEEPWRPQLTIAMSQWGFVDRKVEEFPASPEFHLGGAVRPEVALGELELGLDSRWRSGLVGWSDPFRLGGAYRLGVTRWAASAGRSDHALGFQIRYGRLQAGLTYSARWIENQLGDSEWIRTTFIHFGVD